MNTSQAAVREIKYKSWPEILLHRFCQSGKKKKNEP
jgi:hypothetical protein